MISCPMTRIASYILSRFLHRRSFQANSFRVSSGWAPSTRIEKASRAASRSIGFDRQRDSAPFWPRTWCFDGRGMYRSELVQGSSCRAATWWGAIPQKTIDNLVMTFRHRCEMVVATAGESISQHLSSHIEPSPVHPPQERQCDASLDEELLQSFRDYGNRWAMIADQINSKHGTPLTSQYIRQRVKVLNERELMDQQFRHVTDIHEPSLSTDSPFNLRPI